MIDADSLRVIKHVKGAHMTFATSVAFSPDEQYIISGGSRSCHHLPTVPEPNVNALHASSDRVANLSVKCACAAAIPLGWLLTRPLPPPWSPYSLPPPRLL